MSETRVTIAEQIAEVDRELGMRRGLYPTWIRNGKLSQAQADRNLACLDAAYATLKFVEKHATEIKLAVKGREP